MPNLKTYLFIVEYIVDNDNGTVSTQKDQGVCHGTSYADAMRTLVDGIAEEDITSIYLYALCDSAIFCVPQDIWDRLKEEVTY